MLAKTLKVLIRVLLLLIIVVLGFTAIFPGWYHEKNIIIDEITARFMSVEEIKWRDEARRKNIPYEEYKVQVLKLREENKIKVTLAENIKIAINAKNDELFTKLLTEAKPSFLPRDLYLQVVENNFPMGFEIIHENISKCNGESIVKDLPPYFISENNSRVINTIKTSPALFEKWMELDCYTANKNYAAQFSSSTDLLKSISIKDKDKLFWEKILKESLSNKSETAKYLIQEGIIVSDNKALAANKKVINYDFLVLLIKQNKLDLVTEFLKKHPNYITEKNLDQEVFESIKNSKKQFEIYSIIPNTKINLENLKIDSSIELQQALDESNVNRIVWLLTLDPDLRFAKTFDTNKNYAKLRRRIIKHLPLLLERGLNLNIFEFKGLDQLATAINLGDVKLVELLLEQDIPMDSLYRGKSILSVATKDNIENTEKIRNLLISKGAHNDLGKLVRKETVTKHDPNCKIGRNNIQQYSTKYLSFLETAYEQGFKAKSSYEICHAGLLLCTKEGDSLDDCFESAPICEDIDNTIEYSKDNPITSLCCPEAAKTRYNEMRCSGLNVLSASMMLSGMGFPETYSVPTFMLNTPEYLNKSEEDRYPGK